MLSLTLSTACEVLLSAVSLISCSGGYPYPYSSAILRHELDAIERRFPLRKPMVVIGHSMGGCIARLLITDTGDKLWMELFKKPPEQVPLSPESRKLFSDALIFQHRGEIGRVIFISAPLRGSGLASNWLGRIGSSLVRSPVTLLKAGRDVIKITTFRSGELKLKRIPNSVDTLAPTNRFVIAINKIPITPGIPYHRSWAIGAGATLRILRTGSCRTGVRTWMAPSLSLSSLQVMARIRTRRLSKKFATFSCSICGIFLKSGRIKVQQHNTLPIRVDPRLSQFFDSPLVLPRFVAANGLR